MDGDFSRFYPKAELREEIENGPDRRTPDDGLRARTADLHGFFHGRVDRRLRGVAEKSDRRDEDEP